MKQSQKLEVCCYSLLSCKHAQEAGAQRIELCSAATEGGLTPSHACVKQARDLFHGELFVMIRPRGGDFYYNDLEYLQMQEEIKSMLTLGVDGFVFGLLLPNGHIDLTRTRQLVNIASPKQVCFHRAFDMCRDFKQALEDLISIPCQRVLTSGGYSTAIEGLAHIQALVEQSQGRIQIMAGSGVNKDNAAALLHAGVDALHASCSSSFPSQMQYKNTKLSMGGSADYDEYTTTEADPIKIKQLSTIIHALQK